MGLRKESSNAAFDQVGSKFDGAGFVREIAGRLVEHCAVTPGSRVLDVACGTGAALLAALPKVGRTGFAVGVDLSTAMVGEADRRRRGAGRGATALMDAERLGFRPQTFDVVCCASAIYMFEDQPAVITGMARLLCDEGRLGISDFGEEDSRWDWYDALLRDLSPTFQDVGGGHLGERGLGDLLAPVGRDVRVLRERLDVVYADAEAWWKAQWTYRGRQYLEGMSPETLETYRREAFTAIEACREPDGGLHWRPEVIYAVAIR
jgi:ubiquinone/menaquinone biosynthesis C-methylase UbiE